MLPPAVEPSVQLSRLPAVFIDFSANQLTAVNNNGTSIALPPDF